MAKKGQGITIDKRINDLYEEFPIMEKLDNENVFTVKRESESSVTILERCDDYFGVTLSKDEVKQVALFFSKLAKYMRE